MAVAIRAITRLQDADDVPVLGADQDGQLLAWDNDAGNFTTASGGGGGGDFSTVIDAAGGGDYTTLAAALAAASAGDALFVKSGTYSGGITISLDGVTIQGESRDGVIIQSPLSSTPAITVTGDDVIIQGVTIDGRRASQSGTGTLQDFSGIYIVGAQRAVVRNCIVKDTLGNGITASGSPTDANYGRITNCTITNTATDGDTPTTGAHLLGIQLINGTIGWQINSNYVSGWSQAIGLWYGANECLVTFNQIVANYGYADVAHTIARSAIEDYGATSTPHGLNVWFGNIIDGTAGHGIECAQGVNGSKFVNNVVQNSSKFAAGSSAIVVIDGGAGERTLNISVTGNTFTGNANTKGATLRGENITIDGNTFFDFTSSGIATGVVEADAAISTGMRIVNNRFSNCRGGVYLSGSIADGVVVAGNVFRNPVATTLPFITLYDGNGHVVDGNSLNGNGTTVKCILVGNAGGGHTISRNVCSGLTKPGIEIERPNCHVINNRIVTTNAFGAISLNGATYANIRWNYCDAGGAARTIYLQGSPTYNVIQENTLVGASATVYESSSFVASATNVITPNHRHTTIVPLTGLSLGAQTIGASEATIAHGLPWIPREIRIVMTSTGMVWKSKASTATNIYLIADDNNRTCEVYVV